MYSFRSVLAAFVLASLVLIQGTTAAAASGYTLFGDATLVHPGHNSNTAVQLRSVATGPQTATFGGIDFETPTGMTVNQLSNLSTDYMFTAGSCGGGAPRFQINVDGRNVFVYIGPPPNYTVCPTGSWINTGNLLTFPVDTSQFVGGTFYDTWAHFVSLYGTHLITGIQLVTDGGWAVAGGIQTVQVDNVMINNRTYTFDAETKDSCKKGGWRNFRSSPGPFKNQGDCVSFFASGGKNEGDD